jgi:hypothetical protein
MKLLLIIILNFLNNAMANEKNQEEAIRYCLKHTKFDYNDTIINGEQSIKAEFKCSIPLTYYVKPKTSKSEKCNARIKKSSKEYTFLNSYSFGQPDSINENSSNYQKAKANLSKKVKNSAHLLKLGMNPDKIIDIMAIPARTIYHLSPEEVNKLLKELKQEATKENCTKCKHNEVSNNHPSYKPDGLNGFIKDSSECLSKIISEK